jgi:hypothetical protein
MNSSRPRRVYALVASALVGALAPGCSPAVVIARDDAAGSGGTSEGGSGMGGSTATAGDANGGDTTLPPPEPPRLLANSVSDFALVQDALGWQYGYDLGSLDTFSLMTETKQIEAYKPPSGDTWKGWGTATSEWTQLFDLGGHPNGTITSKPSNAVLQRAVRRWVSTYAGDIIIKGELAKIDTIASAGGNGIDGLIYVDGVQIYTQFIAADDAGGVIYQRESKVDLGSTVDFVLDPHEGNDRNDLTRFTAVIFRADAATQ